VPKPGERGEGVKKKKKKKKKGGGGEEGEVHAHLANGISILPDRGADHSRQGNGGKRKKRKKKKKGRVETN